MRRQLIGCEPLIVDAVPEEMRSAIPVGCEIEITVEPIADVAGGGGEEHIVIRGNKDVARNDAARDILKPQLAVTGVQRVVLVDSVVEKGTRLHSAGC